MVRPARYAVSAEVKVAARCIVFDGCGAMNGSTPAQESAINAPRWWEIVSDAARCRTPRSVCAQNGVRSPWLVSTSVACSMALIASSMA